MSALWLLTAQLLAAPLVLEGELTADGPAFEMVPFDVPAGTVEVQVTHPIQQPENILDYGVLPPGGVPGVGHACVGRGGLSRVECSGRCVPHVWAR